MGALPGDWHSSPLCRAWPPGRAAASSGWSRRVPWVGLSRPLGTTPRSGALGTQSRHSRLPVASGYKQPWVPQQAVPELFISGFMTLNSVSSVDPQPCLLTDRTDSSSGAVARGGCPQPTRADGVQRGRAEHAAGAGPAAGSLSVTENRVRL